MKTNAMRRFLAISFGTLLTSATAGVVLASYQPNPSFDGKPAAAMDDHGNLEVRIKGKELATGQKIDATAKAEVTAVFACVNRNNPDVCVGGPKRRAVVVKEIEKQKETYADSSWKVDTTLTLRAPEAPASLDCPDFHLPTLISIEWDGIHGKLEQAGKTMSKEADPSYLSEEFVDCQP